MTRSTNMSLLINISGFLDLFGVSMFIPLMSKYAKELGASPSMAGMLGSVYGLLQLFSSPVVGQWSDISGHRYVLILCLLITAGGYFMMALATSLVFLAIARILPGLFKHSQSIAKAYIADVTPKEDQSAAFGTFAAYSSIGFIVGPLCGGHIASLPGGFSIVAAIGAFIFVINAAILWYFVPEAVPTKSEIDGITREESTVNLRRFNGDELNFSPGQFIDNFKKISWDLLWDIFLIKFLQGFGVMIYRSNFILMLDYRYQTTPAMNGYIISYSGIIGALSGFLVGKICGFYKNDAKLLCHTAIVQMFMFLALTYAPSIWVLILFLTPLGVANQVARVCVTNIMLRKSANTDTGALMGLGQSTMSLGRMLSPAIGGFAQEFSIYGPGWIAVGSAGLAVIIQILFLKDPQNDKKKTN
ncbi:unnamed protein product [Owenia fusiformis]|uniref:Uncharacterized protein n=1 Tax=Owenia fusiformis TaxID=6347 RepID=A0A8J1XKI6_OWEFU|nr:unnamed protein product [Owenia fusiformis]